MTRPAWLLRFAPAALLVCATPALSTTINFDGQALDSAVGSTYAADGVTFSNAKFAATYGLPGTTGLGGVYSDSGNYYSFGLADAVAGVFSPTINYLSFTVSDVGAAGVRLEAFDALGAMLGFASAFGTGLGKGNVDFVSIAADGIAAFKIYQPNYDNMDGMIVDNMTFTAASEAPEPATWAMMVGGFGLLGAAMRRRRTRTSVRFV